MFEKKRQSKKNTPPAPEEKEGPEIPMDGNLTFLKIVEKLLTPEEIKAAAEEGTRMYQESMKKRRS